MMEHEELIGAPCTQVWFKHILQNSALSSPSSFRCRLSGGFWRGVSIDPPVIVQVMTVMNRDLKTMATTGDPP